jgi:hypothetical protein
LPSDRASDGCFEATSVIGRRQRPGAEALASAPVCARDES